MSHHEHDADPQEQRETLAKLVKKFRTAMLTTVDEQGRITSRPMTPLGDEFEGDFWFATERDNPVVAQVQAQPHVNVTYMDEGNNHFVSASGEGSIVTDRAQIERLWNRALDVFFEGKHDPRVVLVRVRATHADYWDGPGNLLTKLAFFATVAATGNHEALSDTGSVEL